MGRSAEGGPQDHDSFPRKILSKANHPGLCRDTVPRVEFTEAVSSKDKKQKDFSRFCDPRRIFWEVRPLLKMWYTEKQGEQSPLSLLDDRTSSPLSAFF